MSEKHWLEALTKRVAQLKWDRDMARVRGYFFVADLYQKNLSQLYEPLQELVDTVWRETRAVQLDASCRSLHW